MLKLGEVLPHIDVEKEIEEVEQEKLLNMDMAEVPGVVPDGELPANAPPDDDEEESPMRQELTRRMIAQRDALAKEND